MSTARSQAPPRPVRRVLRAVRRRYHALPPECRPALLPSSCYGMLRDELLTLARAGYYPLPDRALTWLTEPPADRARRRRRRERRAAAIARQILASDLPAAHRLLHGGDI